MAARSEVKANGLTHARSTPAKLAALPWSNEASMGEESEASKDPRAAKASTPSDNDISGHHRNVYVGVHLPGRNLRRSGGGQHHSRGGGGRHRHRGKHLKTARTEGRNRPVTPPAQRVQWILGEDGEDNGHEPHPLFSEMEELVTDVNGELEWKETARWVKFEEDVEEGGNRWSKPHVATLSLHSLFELRSLILNGSICLDMEASTLEDVAELVLDNVINTNQMSFDRKALVKDAILKRHRHQYEGLKKHSHEYNSAASNLGKLPIIRSLADIGRNHSTSKSHPTIMTSNATVGFELHTSNHLNRNRSDLESGSDSSTANLGSKLNSHFMKKLPKGSEASNILVGELAALDKPIAAFVRLNESVMLGDLTEVPLPTRFIFFLLGPPMDANIKDDRYHEVGRAVATLMADEVFHDVAYKARKREHLLAGIDEFLDAVTVLPPGEWDPSIRIEPPQMVPSQEGRKYPKETKKEAEKGEEHEEDEEQKQRVEAGLTRSGRLFGGLINDIKRKKPFYWSDFKDGLAVQCIASYIFIYFACLTPIITFGGLLGDATENRVAAIESMVSGLIVGVTYGLFSGQPLTILGSTGPILVFETILYDFCKGFGWAYLSFRFWTGLWAGFFLLCLVAFDASAFICYITRFTEENFATLIAFIFIKKAIDKVIHIAEEYPINPSECTCTPLPELSIMPNVTMDSDVVSEQRLGGPTSLFLATNDTVRVHGHVYSGCEIEVESGVSISGFQSLGCHYVPNAFLMSLLLFLGTFLISFHLKKFKMANFFPNKVRSLISDFAVIIAILSMTLTDFFVGVQTPKLTVPETLRPTWSGRGWLINPYDGIPIYAIFIAILPALLGTILIFMDQQITAVIVNRKEHKLLKGGGYHLDLLIVTLLIVVCSIFGLPWFVAATVLSINHVKSLTRESETAAPGEKPQFLGIREQRVTHVLIFLTIGLSVMLGKLLKYIPMPVLYGVFLYMGVASLNGLQFYDRLLLFLMPKKYQPDFPYLRKVPLSRVHLFTGIQFGCLVVLWVIKDIKQTSILFPLMWLTLELTLLLNLLQLVVMMGVRKVLDVFFSKQELKILDDILPEFKRHERIKEEEEALQEKTTFEEEPESRLRYTPTSIEVPLANGNVMKIPMVDSEINISEEVNRSGVWKSLEGSNSAFDHKNTAQEHNNDTLGGTGRSHGHVRRMSIVEEDDEDVGIQMKFERVTREKRIEEVGSPDEMAALMDNEKIVVVVTSDEDNVSTV